MDLTKSCRLPSLLMQLRVDRGQAFQPLALKAKTVSEGEAFEMKVHAPLLAAPFSSGWRCVKLLFQIQMGGKIEYASKTASISVASAGVNCAAGQSDA
jgi:hypothetical protein